MNLMYSLGFVVATERDQGKQPGDVIDVLWNSPAFEAGLTPGAKILAIDGEEFDPDLLEAVIKRAQRDRAPIELSVQNGAYFTTLHIQYAGGPKYPRLERLPGKTDWLTPVLMAR